jgi:hypothetical protein
MHDRQACAEDKIFSQERVQTMPIEKKSLISTLKTTKKANVASAPTTDDGAATRKTTTQCS